MGLSLTGKQLKAGLDCPSGSITLGESPAALLKALLFQPRLGKLEAVG